jgi:hypothetical protein
MTRQCHPQAAVIQAAKAFCDFSEFISSVTG